MKKLDEDYIEQRAKQLAFIFLTQRSDLIVVPGQDPVEPDYLVSIGSSNSLADREFGVLVAGQLGQFG